MNKTESKHRLPRVAASSYLNTAPLIWSFLYGSKRGAVELFTHEAPSRCAEMLSSGEVDAALVPVIEYQRISDIVIVPDVCVGSGSAVRSVVIASKQNNLKKIKRVARDEGLANLDKIATQHGDQTLTAEEIKDYLTRNIAFQLDEDMMKGLQLFFDLAGKHKLTDETKHLKFIGD